MRSPLSLIVLVFASCWAFAQNVSVVRVQIDSPSKLKPGATVRAHTVEPLFENNKLIVPAGTPVEGIVAEVSPASHDRRLDAKFHGDFTPLHEVKIKFEQFEPESGKPLPMRAALAEQGSDVVVFHSRGVKNDSIFHR